MYKLLRISGFDFIDEKTGKPIRGGKVVLMNNEPTSAESALGFDTDLKSIPYEVYVDVLNQLGTNPVLPVNVDVSTEGSLNSTPRIKGIKVVSK